MSNSESPLLLTLILEWGPLCILLTLLVVLELKLKKLKGSASLHNTLNKTQFELDKQSNEITEKIITSLKEVANKKSS